MKYPKAILFAPAAILLVVLLGLWRGDESRSMTADRMLLLLPDGTRKSDPGVTVWLDAAQEEGLHVVAVHDSEFLSPVGGEIQCAGIILPDSIHRQASDLLVAGIEHFVSDGGKLMLVYDAGTFSLSNRYAAPRSRFSQMVGVDYALYNKLADQTIQWLPQISTEATMRQFEIPP